MDRKIVGKSHKNSREKHLTLLKEKRMHKRHSHHTAAIQKTRLEYKTHKIVLPDAKYIWYNGEVFKI